MRRRKDKHPRRPPPKDPYAKFRSVDHNNYALPLEPLAEREPQPMPMFLQSPAALVRRKPRPPRKEIPAHIPAFVGRRLGAAVLHGIMLTLAATGNLPAAFVLVSYLGFALSLVRAALTSVPSIFLRTGTAFAAAQILVLCTYVVITIAYLAGWR